MGKVFIDAGAYLGDSVLIMREYHPSRILAFEPSRANQKLFREVMAANHVTGERVHLVSKGLPDCQTNAVFEETAVPKELDETKPKPGGGEYRDGLLVAVVVGGAVV